MRDLNECKAEIFRRSEKRIKNIKRKRRAVIIGLIPILLCVAVLALPSVLQLKSESNGASDQFNAAPEYSIGENYAEDSMNDGISVGENAVEDNAANSSLNETSPLSFIKLDVITPDGEAVIIENQNKISSAYSLINRLNSADNNKFEVPDESSDNLSADSGYTLTFILENGQVKSYILSENKIVDNQSGKTISLQHDDFKKIKSTLNLK